MSDADRPSSTADSEYQVDHLTPVATESDAAPEFVAPPDPVTDRWLFWLTWVLSYVFACTLTLADPDLWGHTLYGIRALELGVLCEPTDPFSYTAPQARWVNHEWLTEMQFGWLWLHCGNVGLWAWRNALVLVVFICSALEMRRQRASLGASVVLLTYGAECLSQFVIFIRPQVATFALFALTLLLLKRQVDGRGRGGIWVLPFLQIFWVNLHGGFLAGLGIVGIYAGFEVLDVLWNRRAWSYQNFQITAVMVACFLATLVNPYGYELYQMLWGHLATDQPVVEWQPLWAARQAPSYYVPFILLGLSLPVSRRWTWCDAAVLAVVGLQAVSHIRHVALLSIACMVLLPGPLTDGLPRLFPHLTSKLRGPNGRRIKLLTMTAALATVLFLEFRVTMDLWYRGEPPWVPIVETRSPVPGMPVRALTFLKREGVTGNLLTDYGWAQFVFWHGPKFKLAFDGRYRTVYSSEIERDFLAFTKAKEKLPPKTAMLDDYPTEIVLLPIKFSAVAYLRQRPDWAELYQDDQAVVFVREVSRFDSLLERKRKGELSIVDTPVWQPFPAYTDLPD